MSNIRKLNKQVRDTLKPVERDLKVGSLVWARNNVGMFVKAFVLGNEAENNEQHNSPSTYTIAYSRSKQGGYDIREKLLTIERKEVLNSNKYVNLKQTVAPTKQVQRRAQQFKNNVFPMTVEGTVEVTDCNGEVIGEVKQLYERAHNHGYIKEEVKPTNNIRVLRPLTVKSIGSKPNRNTRGWTGNPNASPEDIQRRYDNVKTGS